MKNELFDELLGSVQEAGKVMRAELQPSREFRSDEPNVKAIWEKVAFTQSKLQRRPTPLSK